ncbi:LysR family substrate-binding domain-containing protein [Nonomuraea sp. NPDC002799]
MEDDGLERRLDIAIGHASQAPAEVTAKLIRLDPLGVLVPDHPFADLDGVPVAALAGQPLLLGEEAQTPELNQFVLALCRSGGFAPTIYEGTVQSTRAAADLVLQHRCVHCIPSSFRTSNRPGTTWRPLTEPATHYPWSLLWHAANPSPTSPPSSTAPGTWPNGSAGWNPPPGGQWHGPAGALTSRAVRGLGRGLRPGRRRPSG